MSKTAPKLTPMMAQFHAIKAQYPDALVMMRLGDFYEMMGEDAEKAAPVLEITLTSRPVGKNERIPLCGVPYHAADRYIAKLIAAGFRVAIADQMEDPKKARGLVKRQVTRVVTPGTVVEEGLLPGHANNFLVAVAQGGNHFGLAVADVSTGEFAVTELRGSEPRRALLDEIARLQPAEILLVHDFLLAEEVRAVARGRVEEFEPRADHRAPHQRLCEHFGVASLRGFGCEDLPLAQAAASAVLDYLAANQLAARDHLHGLATYSTDHFLFLDATARRNLELTQTQWGSSGKSLLQVLDRTMNPGGARLLRQWIEHPLLDVDTIHARQDAVAEFHASTILRHDATQALKGIADLPRLVSRAATGAANPRDMGAMASSLGRVPDLLTALAPCQSSLLCVLREALDPCEDLRDMLAAALVDDPPLKMQDGGYIRPGHSADLDRLRDMAANGRQYIANLEASERERTGIRNLKVGYNSVFGYFLEVSKSNVPLVPPEWRRKQTTANGERYVTPELKEFESAVLGADEKIAALETELFRAVREAVAAQSPRLLALAAALAQVDALLSLAKAAADGAYARPEVNTSDAIHIVAGRHPVVERTQTEPFIPNDAHLNADQRLIVLTGPNMAGKCVAGDTLVFTSRGVLPIKDLAPANAAPEQFADLGCAVQGACGRSLATHFYAGGRQKTVWVGTRTGYTIHGTPEHRIWVRHPDGSEGWKRLDEITTKDIVAIQRGADLWGSETAIDPEILEKINAIPRGKQYSIPTVLDADLAYLIGLLVGDGTVTYDDCFMLSTADAFIADEFRRIVREKFGYEAGCKANGKDYFVTSVRLRAFLGELGLGHVPAHGKRVPSAILRAPRDIVVAFLQGLYDTDGWAENRYGNVMLSTASPEMARETQMLLLNLGMVCPLHAKKTAARPAYTLAAWGADAMHFHQHVGFRLPRKRERAHLASDTRMPNVGGIPHLESTLNEIHRRIVATAGKPEALKHNKRINSIFYTYLPSGRNISHSKLDELITYCQDNDVSCPELEAIQRTRYFYDPVAGVGESESEVFDLSVEPDHAYNAGGFVSHNSTFLRQVALIVLMAQMGGFVPAESAAIGVVDRVFTRIGAHDDLSSGQSTFMVEMNETANILAHATERSLVILDEIGRGTSTYDGLSIAWAVAEFLAGIGCKTLFATHYHHLNDLEKQREGVRNYRIAVREDGHRILWLRKIVRGGTDKSYGVQVARLAGLPPEVIARAREVLEQLEGNGKGMARVEKVDRLQLTLFEAAEPEVVKALRALDVDSLTPLDALTLLNQWKHDLET